MSEKQQSEPVKKKVLKPVTAVALGFALFVAGCVSGVASSVIAIKSALNTCNQELVVYRDSDFHDNMALVVSDSLGLSEERSSHYADQIVIAVCLSSKIVDVLP